MNYLKRRHYHDLNIYLSQENGVVETEVISLYSATWKGSEAKFWRQEYIHE